MNNFFFKLFYIFFIILVIACNNDKSLKQSEKESHTNNCIDIEKYYNEFLTSDSITINNSISYYD